MHGNSQHSIGDFTWDDKDFLGEGSFGKVYKGKNSKTGEVVAVKCLDMKQMGSDKFLLDSLETEIDIMK